MVVPASAGPGRPGRGSSRAFWHLCAWRSRDPRTLAACTSARSWPLPSCFRFQFRFQFRGLLPPRPDLWRRSALPDRPSCRRNSPHAVVPIASAASNGSTAGTPRDGWPAETLARRRVSTTGFSIGPRFSTSIRADCCRRPFGGPSRTRSRTAGSGSDCSSSAHLRRPRSPRCRRSFGICPPTPAIPLPVRSSSGAAASAGRLRVSTPGITPASPGDCDA